MAKRLIDIDDRLLSSARAHLGTDTIKDTVNAALAEAAGRRDNEVEAAFEVLGAMTFTDADRENSWKR
jgi:Arc/MetJ family transcription regulator